LLASGTHTQTNKRTSTMHRTLHRRAECGGLSVALVFSRQSQQAASRGEPSLLELLAPAPRDAEKLQDIFVDTHSRSGTDQQWLALNAEQTRDVEKNQGAVSRLFPKAPIVACALIYEMHRSWSAPTSANSLEAPVELTDWAVLSSIWGLLGKDREHQAMAFIGNLYKVSPRQAALALHQYAKSTHDFYVEHLEQIEELI
jgi:hypothetical protein